MNKEEMIKALKDLAQRINLEKFDLSADEKPEKLKELQANIDAQQKEIDVLKEKLANEENYKEGSEYYWKEKSNQRIQEQIDSLESKIANVEGLISSYENDILENNRILRDTGFEIRKLGNPLPENMIEEDKRLKGILEKTRNDNDIINQMMQPYVTNLNNFKNELNSLNTKLDTEKSKLDGLSLVNKDAYDEDKTKLEEFEASCSNAKDLYQLYDNNYGNELYGIISKLSNDELSVSEAGKEFEQLIGKIPQSFFDDEEEKLYDELERNRKSQKVYEKRIADLRNKLDNKETYFLYSELSQENIMDDYIKWFKKELDNENDITLKVKRVEEINEEIDFVNEIIKNHETQIKSYQNGDYADDKVKYFTKFYTEHIENEKAKLESLNTEKVNIQTGDYLSKVTNNDALTNIVLGLRKKLSYENIKRAEEIINKYKSDKKIEFETLIDDKISKSEAGKDLNAPVLDNSAIRLAETELGAAIAGLNALKVREAFISKKVKDISNQIISNNEELTNDGYTINSNKKSDELTDSINKELKRFGVQTNPKDRVELPNKKETSEFKKETVEPVEKEEVVSEPGKFKAIYKNASDKLKEKARSIKNSKKLAKWAKRLTALAVAAVIALGAGKMLTMRNINDIQDPKVIEKLENGDKSIQDLLEEDKKEQEEKDKAVDEENKFNEENEPVELGHAKVKTKDKDVVSSTNKNDNEKDNSNSQKSSTYNHDNSDEITVPEDKDNKDDDKSAEDIVPDAVITDNDKDEVTISDENKDDVTISDENKDDVTINDENKDEEKEDVYDNSDAIVTEPEQDEITIEDSVTENTNEEKEDVYDNADDVKAPFENDNSNITIEDAPSDITIEEENNNNVENKDNEYDNTNSTQPEQNNNATIDDAPGYEEPVKQEPSYENNTVDIQVNPDETLSNGDETYTNDSNETQIIQKDRDSYLRQSEFTVEQYKQLRDDFANYSGSEVFEEEARVR